jgi:hypothetical protein
MSLTKRGALAVTVCAYVLSLSFPSPAVTAQTRNRPTWPVFCSREPRGEYSRGAVLLVAGSRYACAKVRNSDWQPGGVTWVRVELVGNDFVLSSPSARGLCERSNPKGEYSPGAVLNESGEVARCATVFDGSFNPAGVSWIDVTLLQGDDFVIRIH